MRCFAKSPTACCARLFHEQTGAILSIEMLLIATLLVIGLIAGVASTRDSLISELSDVAGSIQDINQCFVLDGIVGHSSSTAGSDFDDRLDFCDSANDPSGAADNCITFDGEVLDELAPPTFSLSAAPGTFDFDAVVTGVGGSATGTIGDGTINTGFTVTTDTGNIAGTSRGSEVRFRENPASSGSFTITYDDPITEVEFWVRSLANIAGRPENLLGNFTLTLSDGTVINNAAFNIIPDVIAANTNYGLFRTANSDRSPLTTVTRGGAEYVTDPGYDGTPNQAAGRLVFPDIPFVSDPPGPNPVGLQSITFERSGGPNGFQATFSTSGRVIAQDP